jgi:hypothetical protein
MTLFKLYIILARGFYGMIGCGSMEKLAVNVKQINGLMDKRIHRPFSPVIP